MSALDKKYDEPDKPVVLTLEEASEKIAELSGRKPSSALPLLALFCSIVIPIVVAFIAPKFQQQTTVKAPTVTLQQFQELEQRVIKQDSVLTYMASHTNTTGLDDMRRELAEWKGNDEQRSIDIQQLKDDVNRYGLHNAPSAK